MYDPNYVEEMEAELNARYDDLRERFGATAADAAMSCDWDDEPDFPADYAPGPAAYVVPGDPDDGSNDIPF